MKKMMLTLVLAIAAGVWNWNQASVSNMYLSNSEEWTLECEVYWDCQTFGSKSDSCPRCSYLSLDRGGITYSLTASEEKVKERIDSIASLLYMVNGGGIMVTLTGVPFTCANYNYIEVTNIKVIKNELKSLLCNQWNTLVGSTKIGYRTSTYCITTKKSINGLNYVKLEADLNPEGFLREDSLGNIYYFPNHGDGMHEYLLYAFNAQVGDKLSHLWIGGRFDPENPDGYNATVTDISNTSPRKFTIQVEYTDSRGNISTFPVYWIEGIGLTTGPVGEDCIPQICDDEEGKIYGKYIVFHHSNLLCAYKNGEQVYISDKGKQYGCEYSGPEIPASDTIPLFIKDGPGTSTIDPVDPNLIYALLQGELLTIKDFSGAEIYCTLVNTTIPSNSPHHVRLQAQPFRDSLSVEITDAGLYEINLTSEAWNYSIYGSFVYGIKEGISLSTPEQPSAQKFVRNGQILILRGDKTYTLTGQEIK